MTLRALSQGEAFLFPRVVTVYRLPSTVTGGLATPYSALRRTELTLAPGLADELPASIQMQRGGMTAPVGLPTDTKRTEWMVLIPVADVPAPGLIVNGDILFDEIGTRYTVFGDYWAPLGCRLHVWKEEA